MTNYDVKANTVTIDNNDDIDNNDPLLIDENMKKCKYVKYCDSLIDLSRRKPKKLLLMWREKLINEEIYYCEEEYEEWQF